MTNTSVFPSILRFLKKWTLPTAIVTGALAYILYANLHCLDFTRPYAAPVVSVVQPAIIFTILFLTFCKVDARSLRPHLSHLWLLLIQCGTFIFLCLAAHLAPHTHLAVVLESAMLCIICPTATSASVVTQKLGGDSPDIIMYTILINFAVAVVAPIFLPLIQTTGNQAFIPAFLKILSKVFPLLICPFIAAQLTRFLLPRLHRLILSRPDLPFYLWAVALCLAIVVTTRSIAHTTLPLSLLAAIAIASLVACILQFYIGRKIGLRVHRPISTCQSLGQKNTVFAIWMGYTFLDPVTSIAGGFYSIWHNLYNTYQLQQKDKQLS